MPKCAFCRQPASNRFGLTYACDVGHALEAAKASMAKKERKAVAEARSRTKAAKTRLKTLSELCQEARKIIQKYARLRDQKFGVCICCGVPKIEDGAHFFPVGMKYRTARLGLNPDQIHGSCAKCNRFVGGGNLEGYKAGLIARYGPKKLIELQELKRKADCGEDPPLTKELVIAMKKHYAKMSRELEKAINGANN